MKQLSLALIVALPLAGCAGTIDRFSLDRFKFLRLGQAPKSALESLTTGGQSAAALDGATEAEKAAALRAPDDVPGAGQVLGMVTVSLGNPNEAGLWLKSNLVTAPRSGRVVLADGRGVNVDLWPTTGGASLSFSAYRALGLGLTELPQVQVMRLP